MATDVRVVAVVAGALALSGCATVSPPDSGFTPSDLAERRTRELDVRWGHTGLDDSLRPPTPDVVYLADDEYAESYVDCMNDAGFDNFQVQGTGVMISDVAQTPETAQAQTIALYVCGASFRIAGNEGYNDAQVDYLYDYYRDELVPCLALHHIEFTTSDVISRKQFADFFGRWSPYASVTIESQDRLFADASIAADCPEAPPGIDAPGWADTYAG